MTVVPVLQPGVREEEGTVGNSCGPEGEQSEGEKNSEDKVAGEEDEKKVSEAKESDETAALKREGKLHPDIYMRLYHEGVQEWAVGTLTGSLPEGFKIHNLIDAALIGHLKVGGFLKVTMTL